MASLIPGFEYDIFISYRQKDNKGDRWVSEFVEALKTELESTFKEEISIYFDINPHDGLLETHDVDASLKEKLKCLVFIPIISRTYCDPKSFAWEHEFKAFVEQASQDHFGLKIKLPNGNVASRVLPVRIHDLDASDINECESVLGGFLRGIEFVYKEAGIDKPLSPNDDEKKNLNNTKYRIQLIKVAHSIKEIILGMKNEPSKVIGEKEQIKESVKEVKTEGIKVVEKNPAKAYRIRFIIPVLVVALLIIAGIIAYPKIFKRNTIEKLRASGERISVAVMPFQNMTNDTIWNIYQLGIQENLINYLSNFPKELLVRQTELISGLLQNKGVTNYASLTSSVAKTVSQKLESNVFISGSIQQSGNKLRINARLTDTKTGEVIKPFEINGLYKEEIIFDLIDSLKREVTDFLIISKLEKDFELTYLPSVYTKGISNSPEAYRNYTYGLYAYSKLEMKNAERFLSQSIMIDSNFIAAKIMLCAAYEGTREYNKAKELSRKLYKQKDQMPIMQQTLVNSWYTHFFQTPNEEIKYIKQLQDYDNQNPIYFWMTGNRYFHMNQYDKAIPEYKKSLDLYDKWDTRPIWILNYSELGISYHKMGQYNEERELYKKAEKDFPDNISIIRAQAILALTERDTVEANEYIAKYLTLLREKLVSETIITTNLASIYSEANILDKASEFYHKAISLDPGNRARYSNLAYFLIDKERDINKGLELADSLLKLNPENYNYMDAKGWGLYKQGKYKEALEILNKSWDLRMENTVFNETAMLPYFHLEAAKKAVAGMN
jgi:tetratricopeptide (TPR) repeat protein